MSDSELTQKVNWHLALTALPILESADFRPGAVHSAPGVMPYYNYSEAADRVVQILYEAGVICPFDWGAWRTEAEHLFRSGLHLLTLCAVADGKIMRCRDVGTLVSAGESVIEVTEVGTPTWELFVAYRRADAPGHAGRLGERLIGSFGKGQVFKDVESLPPGVDFVDVVRDRLRRATAMVVIIGPHWQVDERLQDEEDLHREEIRTALQRGIHIVPVLVNGADVPSKDSLPEDIQLLVRRQAVEVTDTRWDYDVGRLVENLTHALAASPRRLRFLAQVPPWGHKGWQWIADDPKPED